MKFVVAVLAAAAAVSAVCASVSAQSVPQTAEFKCPATGTALTMRGFDGESQMAATGQDGTVCLFKSTKAGQTRDLRVHYGLIGSRLLDMGATQLEGEIDIDYAATGLRCRLRFPLDAA